MGDRARPVVELGSAVEADGTGHTLRGYDLGTSSLGLGRQRRQRERSSRIS
jgi:hypothetical protein